MNTPGRSLLTAYGIRTWMSPTGLVASLLAPRATNHGESNYLWQTHWMAPITVQAISRTISDTLNATDYAF